MRDASSRIDRTRAILLAIIVIGTIVRAVFVLMDNPVDHLFSDPKRHWDNATRLFSPSLMNGCDPIVYQIYLAVLQFATAGNKLLIGLTSACLSAIMPWFYYKAGRELGLDKTPALVLWALVAWCPSIMTIYRFFMIETLFLPLIGVALWATGRALRKKTLSAFLVMTLCLVLAMLTKPQALPLGIICWAFVLTRMQDRFLPAGLSVLLTALLLIPNAVRTYSILGYVAPFGSGYIAQIMHASGARETRFHWKNGTWSYSSPSCYVRPLEPLNGWLIERAYVPGFHEVTIDRAAGRKSWQDALDDCHRSFGVFMTNLGENVVLFLFAPSWPDSDRGYFLGALTYYSRWLWAPLLSLVAVGNISFFCSRRIHIIPLVTSVSVAILMLQNSVTTEGRYRKPVEPLILLNVVWLLSLPSTSRKETAINKTPIPQLQ